MTILSVLSLILSLYVCSIQGQEQCRTPKDANGKCIPINECPALATLVQNVNRSEEDLKLLRNSHCGFTQLNYPKVCCPLEVPVEDNTCFTPDENVGSCINVQQCGPIRNIIRPPVSETNRVFAVNSRCEGPPNSINVCCGPTISEAVKKPIKTCKPTAMPRDPNTECCGLDNSAGNRIFGGTTAAIDQFPWLTMIEYLGVKDRKIKLLCGGALISHKYVLSAGHCVVGPVLKVGTP